MPHRHHARLSAASFSTVFQFRPVPRVPSFFSINVPVSFTGDQRYFLSFGQIWRAKYRDSALRAQILSNPHSPAKLRVIGPTRNDDAWYEAFNVKPGDKYFLARDQRVELW